VLWRDYMKTVVGALPEKWYDRPAGIVDAVVCVNPSIYGGTGSGELPGPGCPSNWRMTEQFIQGTEPKSNGSSYFSSTGCIQLRAPFADWQPYYNKWAQGAVSGQFSYGRFSWSICGFTAQPSGSPSGAPPGFPGGPGASPTAPPPQPQPTPRPTNPPPTKKP